MNHQVLLHSHPCRAPKRFPLIARGPLLIATLLALSLPPAGARGAETSPPGLAPAEPMTLFNGRDLAGFHSWLKDSRGADPRGVFSVTNREIRISGDGLGYLATDRRFRDYRLVVEWRWGLTNTAWGDRIGRCRDSGVFVHASGPDGNSYDGGGAFMAAIECNLFEGASGDLLLIRGTDERGQLLAPRLTVEVAPTRDREGWWTWLPGGRPQAVERWGRVNWLRKSRQWEDRWGFRGAADQERPVGEWNLLECVCEGKRVQVFLNNKLVNEATEVAPSEGRILLQCEGSEIFFRRVELFPAAAER